MFSDSNGTSRSLSFGSLGNVGMVFNTGYLLTMIKHVRHHLTSRRGFATCMRLLRRHSVPSGARLWGLSSNEARRQGPQSSRRRASSSDNQRTGSALNNWPATTVSTATARPTHELRQTRSVVDCSVGKRWVKTLCGPTIPCKCIFRKSAKSPLWTAPRKPLASTTCEPGMTWRRPPSSV
jgi:hypothetical protein